MLYGADNKPIKHSFTESDYTRDRAIVKQHAKKDCKKCHGTGILGKSVKTGKLLVCKCVDRQGLLRDIQIYQNVTRGGIIGG